VAKLEILRRGSALIVHNIKFNNSHKLKFLSDGDYPTRPSITLANDPSPARESKEVKEVHALVRNHVYKEESELPISYRFWPDFVSLLEQNVEGEISCTHHLLEA